MSWPSSDGFESMDVVFDGMHAGESATPRLEVYLMDISYFSGKLEAYLRYKRIPFRRVNVTLKSMGNEIFDNTGLMQVPVLHDTVTKKWYRDTTSIIRLIEESPETLGLDEKLIRARPVLPADGPTRFYSVLLEDYFDEWLWTPALYYRWEFRLDAGNLARRFLYHDFGREFSIPGLPMWLAELTTIDRQYDEYVANAGVRDEAGKAFVEAIYKNTLKILEAHFAKHAFLLGSRPTFADFGLMASMYRHFSLDPTPAKIMRLTAPNVYEWVARMWNGCQLGDDTKLVQPKLLNRSGELEKPYETLTPFLIDFSKTYIPYLLKNAQAVVCGASSLTFGPLKDRDVSPFHAWTALQLIKVWETELVESERVEIARFFDNNRHGGDNHFDAFISSRDLFAKGSKQWTGCQIVSPPHCPTREQTKKSGQHPLVRVFGSPNHQAKPPLFKTKLNKYLFLLLLTMAVSSSASASARRAWMIAIGTIAAFTSLRAKFL